MLFPKKKGLPSEGPEFILACSAVIFDRPEPPLGLEHLLRATTASVRCLASRSFDLVENGALNIVRNRYPPAD